MVRPFLTQSDLSVENGFFRPFSTEARIGLSYTVGKGLFRLNFFRLGFPTQLFSTEFSDCGIQSKNLAFLTGSASRKTQSKKFTRYIYIYIFEPIASLIQPQNTHPHAHTPVPGTTQQYLVSYNTADAGLAITAVASRRKSAWCTPSSACQQRV